MEQLCSISAMFWFWVYNKTCKVNVNSLLNKHYNTVQVIVVKQKPQRAQSHLLWSINRKIKLTHAKASRTAVCCTCLETTHSPVVLVLPLAQVVQLAVRTGSVLGQMFGGHLLQVESLE